MMNRRQFLTYTIALAAAAPLAKLSIMPTDAAATAAPAPIYPSEWIPTEDEVHEWLQYYKLTVQMRSQKFHEAVGGLFSIQTIRGPVEIETTVDPALFQEAEIAFNSLAYDRGKAGYAMGQGYAAGRWDHYGVRGANAAFTGPSNEGFAWHNGWIVGHNDLHNRVTPA